MLEVHVEKGMQNGQKIVFEGQADEAVSKLRSLPTLFQCFLSHNFKDF